MFSLRMAKCLEIVGRRGRRAFGVVGWGREGAEVDVVVEFWCHLCLCVLTHDFDCY
jgi:hypothetical protein